MAADVYVFQSRSVADRGPQQPMLQFGSCRNCHSSIEIQQHTKQLNIKVLPIPSQKPVLFSRIASEIKKNPSLSSAYFGHACLIVATRPYRV